MNACRRNRRAWRAALDGGTPRAAGAEKEHAAVCAECRRRDEDLKAVLAGAEAVRGEIEKTLDGVDWDGLSARIADAAAAQARTRRVEAAGPARARASAWRWRPLLAGAAAGLLIGVLATFVYLRRPAAAPGAAPAAAASESYAVSGEFLRRVELEMAKRETLDYLEKSEYVLLDVLAPRPAGPVKGVPAGAAEARELLAKKRYFNAHLDDIRMAKARMLCDQIEILFLELSQAERTMTPAQSAEIRRYVEDKQLLLQIRLLKKELRESEA